MLSTKFFVPVAAVALFLSATSAVAQTDPGVQGGAARAGGPLPGLTGNELAFFAAGDEDFEEAEGIADGRQMGAGELQVAAGLLEIRQRHLQFIHRMVCVAEQGL